MFPYRGSLSPEARAVNKRHNRD